MVFWSGRLSICWRLASACRPSHGLSMPRSIPCVSVRSASPLARWAIGCVWPAANPNRRVLWPWSRLAVWRVWPARLRPLERARGACAAACARGSSYASRRRGRLLSARLDARVRAGGQFHRGCHLPHAPVARIPPGCMHAMGLEPDGPDGWRQISTSGLGLASLASAAHRGARHRAGTPCDGALIAFHPCICQAPSGCMAPSRLPAASGSVA